MCRPSVFKGDMMNELERAMKNLSDARIRKYERALKLHSDEQKRHNKRSKMTTGREQYPRPSSWAVRPDFDPFHVRSKADVYSHAIRKAIASGSYEVRGPVNFEVEKAGGGTRQITSFGIPDEAVSRNTYASLMNKNRALLSSRSYAYRNDLNVFDAIDYVSREWRVNSRLYLAEFDLNDYFGSIRHEYIMKSIKDLRLYMTAREKQLCERFMRAPRIESPDVSLRTPAVGVPQGTSLSLLLANVALTPLDRQLERLQIGFARFSDDLLMWGTNYDAISRAVDHVHAWSEASGVQLSIDKSPGIRIMTRSPLPSAEMQVVKSTQFLSHTVTMRSVDVGPKPLTDLKSRVRDLIYANLLREVVHSSQDLSRLKGGTDRDYVTLVSQLRRLLYGALSESQVRRLSRTPYIPRIYYSGKVANHPILTGSHAWQEFDQWLAQQVWLALRKRKLLLQRQGFTESCLPWDCRPQDLYEVRLFSSVDKSPVDAQLPSAARMSKVIKRSTALHGTKIAEKPAEAY